MPTHADLDYRSDLIASILAGSSSLERFGEWNPALHHRGQPGNPGQFGSGGGGGAASGPPPHTLRKSGQAQPHILESLSAGHPLSIADIAASTKQDPGAVADEMAELLKEGKVEHKVIGDVVQYSMKKPEATGKKAEHAKRDETRQESRQVIDDVTEMMQGGSAESTPIKDTADDLAQQQMAYGLDVAELGKAAEAHVKAIEDYAGHLRAGLKSAGADPKQLERAGKVVTGALDKMHAAKDKYLAQADAVSNQEEALTALDEAEPETETDLPEDAMYDEPEEPDEFEPEEVPEKPEEPAEPDRAQYDSDEDFAPVHAEWQADMKDYNTEVAAWEHEAGNIEHANKTGQKAYDAAKKDFDKAHAKWEKDFEKATESHHKDEEKAHDKWEKDKEKLEGRIEKDKEKLTDLEQKFDAATSDGIEAIDDHVGSVLEKIGEQIDEEEEGDPEPDEDDAEEQGELFAEDAHGHAHKGPGEGGGQFTSKDSSARDPVVDHESKYNTKQSKIKELRDARLSYIHGDLNPADDSKFAKAIRAEISKRGGGVKPYSADNLPRAGDSIEYHDGEGGMSRDTAAFAMKGKALDAKHGRIKVIARDGREVWIEAEAARPAKKVESFTEDVHHHQHKDAGPGGGQFTAKPSGGRAFPILGRTDYTGGLFDAESDLADAIKRDPWRFVNKEFPTPQETRQSEKDFKTIREAVRNLTPEAAQRVFDKSGKGHFGPKHRNPNDHPKVSGTKPEVKLHAVKGNSFAHKDAIKQAGGVWDSEARQWVVDEAGAAKLKGKAGLRTQSLTNVSADVRRAFTKEAKPVEDFAEPWNESKHPRGQPENKGEFGPGGGGANRPSQSQIGALVSKYKGQIKEAKFAGHLPAVRTVASTKDNPLASHEHTTIAHAHALAGAEHHKHGRGDMAQANFAAARYHNETARRKSGEEAGKSALTKSKAKVSVGSGPRTGKKQVDEFIDKHFGGDIDSIASAVGAPDDAKVWVESDKETGGLNVYYDSDKMDSTCERKIGVGGDGKLYLKNEFISVAPEHQKSGIGSKIFTDQVAWASRMGISRIEAHAARKGGSGEDEFNGYYTWPRLGYDQDLKSLGDDKFKKTVKQEFPEAKSVLDVMKTKDGRDWWKKNGVDMHEAKFDLTPGSRSMRILEAYKKERGKAG